MASKNASSAGNQQERPTKGKNSIWGKVIFFGGISIILANYASKTFATGVNLGTVSEFLIMIMLSAIIFFAFMHFFLKGK